MGSKKMKKLRGNGPSKKKQKNKDHKKALKGSSENAMDTDNKARLKVKSKKKDTVVFARPKNKKNRGGGNSQNHVVRQCKADNMTQIHAIPRAHGNSIMQILIVGDEIFTVAQDKKLKTWVKKTEPTGTVLELVRTLDMDDPCWSMTYAEDTLFVGLQNGKVNAFSKAGGKGVLDGHTKRVTAILVEAGIIITGSQDKTLRFWQVENGAFLCRNTIEMNAEVNKLLITSNAANERVLWIGTDQGLVALNLADILQPPVKVAKEVTQSVRCLLEYADHIMVGYKDGSIKLLGKDGTEKNDMRPFPDCKHLHSITVLDKGPRLICGFFEGRVSSFSLPSFERRAKWEAFVGVTTCVQSLGPDGHFLLGSNMGDLQLWQHTEPEIEDDDL